MPDLYTATLARLDELEKLAQCAAARIGGSVWRVRPDRHEVEVLAWMGDGPDNLSDLGRWNQVGIWNDDYLDTGERPGDVYGPIVDLIAAFDPAAILELVANGRDLAFRHRPQNGAEDLCRTCDDPAGYPERYPCPTFVAAARMIGVKADA